VSYSVKYQVCVAGLLTTFGLVRPLAGQYSAASDSATNHGRYKVVLTRTFGGPDGHVFIGGNHVLNNNGTFVGSADTSNPDPYAPDGCFNGDDCFATHAYMMRNGKMTDLGTIDNFGNSETVQVTDNGLIIGNSQNGLVDAASNGWEMHGVLWRNGKLIDLGTLGGGPLSVVSAVNSSGEVVGLSLTAEQDPFSIWGFYQTRAFRWKDGMMIDLGTLGGPDAVAVRINERGQITGNSFLSVDPSPVCGIATGAFLWEEGRLRDIGGFGGSCTTASDMNDRGEIVGSSFLAGDQQQRPFLWRDGRMTDLGTLGGNFASPFAINNQGTVVGLVSLPPDDQAFHGTLWNDGHVTDLGALNPGQCSVASAVNANGQIVGLSGDCSFYDPTLRAVISDNGKPFVDLNTLIPANAGVQLRNATYINDRGEIVAVGYFPDGHHAPVLLIPNGLGHD
jgi:probable HAF family extracellular repeat protein